MFPKIQRPCPYKNDLASIMDGDVCRVCVRQVHDLNAMSDVERAAFLASCSGDICVSYSLRPAIATAVAALAFALPAAAQEVEYDEIIVGGITAAQIEYIADPNAVETPEAPVVYEDDTAQASEDATAETSAASAPNLNDAVEPQ